MKQLFFSLILLLPLSIEAQSFSSGVVTTSPYSDILSPTTVGPYFGYRNSFFQTRVLAYFDKGQPTTYQGLLQLSPRYKFLTFGGRFEYGSKKVDDIIKSSKVTELLGGFTYKGFRIYYTEEVDLDVDLSEGQGRDKGYGYGFESYFPVSDNLWGNIEIQYRRKPFANRNVWHVSEGMTILWGVGW